MNRYKTPDINVSSEFVVNEEELDFSDNSDTINPAQKLFCATLNCAFFDNVKSDSVPRVIYREGEDRILIGIFDSDYADDAQYESSIDDLLEMSKGLLSIDAEDVYQSVNKKDGLLSYQVKLGQVTKLKPFVAPHIPMHGIERKLCGKQFDVVETFEDSELMSYYNEDARSWYLKTGSKEPPFEEPKCIVELNSDLVGEVMDCIGVNLNPNHQIVRVSRRDDTTNDLNQAAFADL